MSSVLSAATFMNILAGRINICQEAFVEAAWMWLPQALQALKQRWEPGQSQSKPFPCSIAMEQDSRATVSPQNSPWCQGNHPAMRERQMVVGFSFPSPPASWQKVKCAFCLVASSPCPVAFL